MVVDTDKDPRKGYSILGAARRKSDSFEIPASASAPSLLDRLVGDGELGDRRGKKRTRNY